MYTKSTWCSFLPIDCDSYHFFSVVCPYSKTRLTNACATVDIFNSPATSQCHLEFHVTIDISRRVVLQLEYIRFDIEHCIESLSVYEGEELLEIDMIERLCSKVLLYDHNIFADWNTMSIIFDRYKRAWSYFRQPRSLFICTYRGVQLTSADRSVGKLETTHNNETIVTFASKRYTWYFTLVRRRRQKWS